MLQNGFACSALDKLACFNHGQFHQNVHCVLHTIYFITSFYLLDKGGYVFGSVGLFVCLSVCGQHYSKSYERTGMKFYGGILGSTRKN